MADYERAERLARLAPESNDDALLRYNCCIRLIQFHKLEPRIGDDSEQPLE